MIPRKMECSQQEWREGEKAGKVTLLRDIDITRPHSGHERILNDLKIPKIGKKKVDSFAKLYTYWQDVFSVNILNKKFYQELSYWYFWAVKDVHFPSEPAAADAHRKKIDLAALRQEHNAKNVIRLLTRFLFVWFVKEKNLIPEELFDIDCLKDELLKDFSPVSDTSVYYKAILQNLFFASLNCPIKPLEKGDNRQRGFRSRKNFGQHRDANYLMRYKNQFENPEKFLQLINAAVPFLNGGLFECLDNKTDKIYIDGFSDNLVKPHQLIVPDYLFFRFDHETDLSGVVGIKTKAFKKARVKGLISILNSYKFTIAENTPIEEDVALDPELLGKVFENLLASYNPETKTTARKQTGSFYTPREIVNYMTDESLIAYLKNSVKNWNIPSDELDKRLHDLLSYDNINPFAANDDLQKQIIHSLDNCKILDPACGSGAFPMGILHKMVHVLQKVDPENKHWHELQVNKAMQLTQGAFAITDKKERENKLIEINEAFDKKINDPDYARKLFLVENCIYGVDIQPIAAQISKLRFFIALIVDQKADKTKPNFGIRALPNLETKFVAANTLIGIDKPKARLFDNQEIKDLEKELKDIRHRLFSAKSPATKRKLRDKDKEIREKMGVLLVKHGWANETAKQLADWDPYNQNTSSPFFDPEWMFDIRNGFDVVIGNPPYIKEYTDRIPFKPLKSHFYYQGKMDLWYFFGCKGIDFLNRRGNICFIATNNWITNEGASIFRNKILKETIIKQFLDFREFMIFESASIQTMVFLLEKNKKEIYLLDYRKINTIKSTKIDVNNLLFQEGKHTFEHLKFRPTIWYDKRITFISGAIDKILLSIQKKKNFVFDKNNEVAQGIVAPQDVLNKKGAAKLKYKIIAGSGIFILTNDEKNALKLTSKELKLLKPFYTTEELGKYYGNSNNQLWVIYTNSSFKNNSAMDSYPNLKNHLDKFTEVITSSNKPYGLHRARKEIFFKGEKIISLRKCTNEPTFSYTDFDCYVSQTFFIIKTNRINQKFLVALLNSSLVAFWLKHKGKMQGTAYQIDKGPILEIPIFCPEKQIQILVSSLVDVIIWCKTENNKQISNVFEHILNALFFQFYFSVHIVERNIDIKQFVEKDLKEVIQNRDFDQLTKGQKEKAINQLCAKWTDPESEIVKRMNSFADKSPDILKPILDSG
ncbi:N-6 DNA methylase [Desulfococcaceae bacterium HSG7]|nr:N-6 DNA methylase [Desulfococcaceae bacterium HSG7]